VGHRVRRPPRPFLVESSPAPMRFQKRLRGVKLATVSPSDGGGRVAHNFDVQYDVHLVKGRHLICACGGEATFRPHLATPGVLGAHCKHITAVYGGDVVESGMHQPQRVSFTPRGHELFDSIWAANLLTKE